MLLIFAVISILAFDMPIAEAADERVLTLSLPTDIEEEAVPGIEIVVPLTIVNGFENADNVEVIQIAIEYNSLVVRVEDTSTGWKGVSDDRGIVIDFTSFGIQGPPIGPWTATANTTTNIPDPQLPNAERLLLGILKAGAGDSLQVPLGGLPAEFLTIKFTVKSDVTASTDLLFVDDDNTFFARDNADKLLLEDDSQNGIITLTEPSPSPVTLSMPSIVIPILQGVPDGLMPLTVVDGYTNEDLIDVIQITIEYDSSVAKVPDNPTIGWKGVFDGDITIDFIGFGIPLEDITKWDTTANVTDLSGDMEQLKIGVTNPNPITIDPLQVPVGGLPADLLTIKFNAVSTEPTDTTRVVFINENHTFFAKRDGTKLPVDLFYDPPGPEDDPHGDIALPVVLSALGAIWHPNGAKIFWEAISQQGNLGWNIYRSETKDGKFVKINGELIKGAGTTAKPIKYSFIDKDSEKGKIYYYYLEDISFSGEKHRTDAIKSIPVNKITSWGDIKRSTLR
jgi:hypothetical protein